MRCSSYGAEAESVSCSVRRFGNTRMISQNGNCFVIMEPINVCQLRDPSAQTKTAVAAFKQSRTLKLERFVNDKLIEAIENEESLENIEELAYSFVNRHAQSRMKQMIKEKVDPVGLNE